MKNSRTFEIGPWPARALKLAVALSLAMIAGCGGGSYGGSGGGMGMGTGMGPAITAQPASQTVAAGSMATFSVTATGGTFSMLAYQWMKNSTNISGATMATYTTPTTTAMDNGASFAVKISNAYGTVTSSPAILIVM
jgi:hypothetical protein